MMREKAEQVRLGYKKEILSTKGYIIFTPWVELYTPKWYWGFYERNLNNKNIFFEITEEKFKDQMFWVKLRSDYNELDGKMPPELFKKIAEYRFAYETQHPINNIGNCPQSGEPWYRWASDDELLSLFNTGQLEAGKHQVGTMNESERQELIKYVQQIEEKRKKK